MSERSGNPAVVIVGAGFGGTVTAVNLLREHRQPHLRIVLIDGQATFGRGVAYRDSDDGLLLNVPAGNMSALADEADDFLRYCRSQGLAVHGGSFVPRRLYGDYLEHLLARTAAQYPGVLEKMAGQVIAVRPADDGARFEVDLAGGRACCAAQVVLALGHAPPRPALTETPGSVAAVHIGDPWDAAALKGIPAASRVMVLGSGHTAIDALLQLAAGDAERSFYLLSRRGLLPQPHRSLPRQPLAASFPHYLNDLPDTLFAYLRALRREIAARAADGGDWRDVINELRPHTPTLWKQLPLRERERFLRHVQPYWDIHRHRLAPAVHAQLQALLDSGRVQVIAGQLLAYEHDGRRLEVTIRERRTTVLRKLTAGAILNCTGPNYDLATLASPLVVQLRNAGLLRQDALKLGLEVDHCYRVIDRHGKPVSGLYYLGPMLRAGYWEATAVPELRSHALQLARRLLADHRPETRCSS